jgi:hypothetical protein
MANFLQAVNSMKARLAQSSLKALIAPWARAVPLKLWLVAGALVLAGLWLQEHDARVRAAAQAQQVKQQTARQVSALEAQARTAIETANRRNAAALASLENQRRQLAQRASELSKQLDLLKQKQQRRTEEIAALPPAALARQLVEGLGPSSVVRGPLQPPTDNGQLALSTEGQRRVVSSLSDLDSCRAEREVEARQVSTCSRQLAADQAEIRTQKDSVARLNQALAAKDQILGQRKKEFQSALAAAHGTWRSRTWHALKMIGIGVGIGVAIR